MPNPTSTSGVNAPGGPGIPPRWTSSAKEGVGTSLNLNSLVWFTLSHGILDEIYYPRLDQACTRDLGLIVTDAKDFFSEEKRNTEHDVEYLAEYVPAYRLVNRSVEGRYRIEKEIFADPNRDVILQRIRFIPLQGKLSDYHVYVLLAPHIGNQGYGNTAWVGDYKGDGMLFAQQGSNALALASSAPWKKSSAGYVGVSDTWQDLFQHKQMTWEYTRAENGNVALGGEVDLSQSDGTFILSLGFGRNVAEAGQRARASLFINFDENLKDYIDGWQAWQKSLLNLNPSPQGNAASPKVDLYHVSTTVMRIHEAKSFPGGLIASLSIPWGFAKGDDDLGGYHLVWPRDQVEMAGGLLAAGANEDARRVLEYLRIIQEADGHWPQNMWLDGTPYWTGGQNDETALPILLVDLACRQQALPGDALDAFWPMVRRAAAFLVKNGPVTQEDRWEEDPGYSPFTLAAEISALLVAADLADRYHEPQIAKYLRETADTWNANIDRWIYVQGTEIAKQFGVEGYYVRIAPPDLAEAASPAKGYVPIKNRAPGDHNSEPAECIVSPDALALVRFGLRDASDARIVNTVKVIDTLLKLETPAGPAWHRYNDDGYGEHEDGSPFDGTGIGRAWPLLTGERAHYELAAGHPLAARDLMHTMETFANSGGMLPEQIWDSHDIPDKELYFSRPSGSAMPLCWAHAEYLKLSRSLHDGQVFDLPTQTTQRYLKEHTGSGLAIWRFNLKIRTMAAGKVLRIETLTPARLTWSSNTWKTIKEQPCTDTGLGMYLIDLPTQEMPSGTVVRFTFYWTDAGHWEGTNYEVAIVDGEGTV